MPKSRLRRARVGLADERSGGVRREVRADHGDADEREHEHEADAGAPEPDRAAQQLEGRPASADDLGHADDGGFRDCAHRRVLRRGVTMIVAMSASRLSTT